jgi:hypothetical protein
LRRGDPLVRKIVENIIHIKQEFNTNLKDIFVPIIFKVLGVNI